MNKTIFIHPGFGRSATTYLQNIFEKHKEIQSIGRPYANKKKNLEVIEFLKDTKIINPKKLNLNFIKNKKTIIFSDENVGNRIFRNQQMILKLKHIFPNSKIFFTIRNQYKIIQSIYSSVERILKNVPKPFNGKTIDFDEWFEFSLKNLDQSFIGYSDFYSIIKVFEKVFKKKNIKVFLYEELTENEDLFFKNLSNYLRITKHLVPPKKKTNNTFTKRQIVYEKLNKINPVKGLTNYLPFGNKIKSFKNVILSSGASYYPVLNIEQKKILKKLYSYNNELLAREYNLNLKKYNYP